LIFTGPRPSVRGATLVLDEPRVIMFRMLVWALVLLAIPVFDKPGMRPDNLTVLDRNYHAGLWISLAVVWARVPLYLLAARLLPVRKKTE
jgi:hypothetical protein